MKAQQTPGKGESDPFAPPPGHPAFDHDTPDYEVIPEQAYEEYLDAPPVERSRSVVADRQKKNSDARATNVDRTTTDRTTTDRTAIERITTPVSTSTEDSTEQQNIECLPVGTAFEVVEEPVAGSDGAASALQTTAGISESADVESGQQGAFNWVTDIHLLGLSGMTQNIALNCGFVMSDATVTLSLDEGHYRLLTEQHQQRIVAALRWQLGEPVKVNFLCEIPRTETPSQRRTKEKEERLRLAVETIHRDTNVIAMMQMFDASILEKTIEPIG